MMTSNMRPNRSVLLGALALLPLGALTFSAPATSALATKRVGASGYHELKKISIPGDGGWDYLTVDPAARRLYVARSSHVSVVDIDSDTLVGDIPNTKGVHGVAIAPKLGKGYTSNGGDNTVTVFDVKTLKEISHIPVGSGPDAIVFEAASRRVFTLNGQSGDATAIDTQTGKVVGTLPLGGRPEFAVSDDKGKVYVNIEDKSEIVQIDAQSLKILNRWPLAPGEEPTGLSIDKKRGRLFSVCANKKMVILDTASGKVIGSPTIGDGPDASAFDPGTGLAISSNGEGNLTLVQTGSGADFPVAATVATQPGARTMALDPKTHRIYLAAAKSLPPAPGETNPRRRGYVPGSFVILVYGK